MNLLTSVTLTLQQGHLLRDCSDIGSTGHTQCTLDDAWHHKSGDVAIKKFGNAQDYHQESLPGESWKLTIRMSWWQLLWHLTFLIKLQMNVVQSRTTQDRITDQPEDRFKGTSKETSEKTQLEIQGCSWKLWWQLKMFDWLTICMTKVYENEPHRRASREAELLINH